VLRTTASLMSHWKWFQLFHLRSGDRRQQEKNPHGKEGSDKTAAEATHAHASESGVLVSFLTHPICGVSPSPLANRTRRPPPPAGSGGLA
jgi:hypothetical protein